MRLPYGNRIAITGASSGLGRAAAELFLRNGFTVYALSRHAEETDFPAESGRLTRIDMDVTEEASVRRAAEQVNALGGAGILLHCAGFGIAGAAEDTDPKDVQRQFETNFFGVLRVNRAFMPAMRRAGRGLVLAAGSVAGIFPIPFQSAYSASKFALEAYMEALRMEAAPFGIRACIIEPGDTKTGFTAARETVLPEGSPYMVACRESVRKMEQDERAGADPSAFAQTALRLARKKNPKPRVVVGASYRLLTFLKRLLPARTIELLLSHLYVPKSRGMEKGERCR